jgi:hypothetical protein
MCFISTTLLVRYSMIGAALSLTVQPAAERSALASLDRRVGNRVHQVAQRDAGLHLAGEAHQHALGHVQRHHAGGGGKRHQARAGGKTDPDRKARVRIGAGAAGVGQQQAIEP